MEMSINIADQEAIDNALPLAQKSGLGVIAKRPIANGLWRSLQRPDEDKNVAYWERLHDLNYSFLLVPMALGTLCGSQLAFLAYIQPS